ncbi:hypothetical protein ACRE_073720 [Hapsidospora chrysogenum ATCC 11550]|uniref:Uncharacterized protein n=1 Tax=Hapsidospora chrysogenum (strain ATCC 11550 / CBS 779.69 / DSM 880 / IAM 14645 / JCM 23072 / IMI 49137) TaxID=857340 RepID=A0A086SXT0_HAPC1|nr:hypothetical protein ACRE_073720 [Hapsidospora chrysogenum ATCC 11550]
MTVWNRIQTVASTTTTTLIQTPAELLPRHHRRRRNRQRRFDLGDELLDDPDHPYHKTHGHNHHQDRADNHHGQGQDQDHPHRDRDTRFWQESFENHLNILAVADDAAPYRYEIHRGKAVPSPTRLTGSRDNLYVTSPAPPAGAQLQHESE